jgi:transcriptional regulator with XRE-family HTH domain
MSLEPSFARLVSRALAERRLGLRELCRRADLDPSYLSKVLSGKRNPPSDEGALRAVAAALELDAVELIVSAGRIPREWNALWTDATLLREVHVLAAGRRRPVRASKPTSPPPILPGRGLSEELL